MPAIGTDAERALRERRLATGATSGPELTAELVRDADELQALEPAWRRLAEARGNAFLTPEWFHAWREHYGGDSEPFVVAVRDEAGELAGVLPLVRQGKAFRFAGANLGDCFEPAARPGLDGAVARCAAAVLPARPGMVVLDNVDAGAAWCRELVRCHPSRLAATRIRPAVLPRARLPLAFDDFLAARSRNFRSEVRRKTRKLEGGRGIRFRRSEWPQEVQPDLNAFFRLHDARWDARGGSSSRGARVRAFHADFAAAALRRGWLRLWLAEADGSAVGAWYGWRLGPTYSYYLAGFDPAWASASVGTVLLGHTVRKAIEEGAEEYDLLLGPEPYKRRFADRARRVETLVVTPALHPRRVAVAAEAGARRTAARLSPRARARLRRAARGVVGRLGTTRNR